MMDKDKEELSEQEEANRREAEDSFDWQQFAFQLMIDKEVAREYHEAKLHRTKEVLYPREIFLPIAKAHKSYHAFLKACWKKGTPSEAFLTRMNSTRDLPARSTHIKLRKEK